jgi:general secretion pathway protein A
LFLEQYKLEFNPFVAEAARPMFASHSMRYAMLKVEELLGRKVQSLFLSGPTGVGKTTLVRQRLRQLKDLSLAWIKPNCDTREQLLMQLLERIGPGLVEGSAIELRHILEVYLRHQASNGRSSFVVADGLERFAAPVLREFESLTQMRLRNRPLIHLLALSRSEELVADLLPQFDNGALAHAAHQRLGGFTADETRAYMFACLRGVVGDINALCCAALDAIAERSTGSNRQPKLTRALLKEAGANLNLRYDASAWAQPVEELSPEAVHLSNPNRLRLESARLIVSSGRTIVAEVTLDRPRMVLGRDNSCDISLDSRYVSRFQNLFMETPEGWMLIDLSSTNGCFVNGRRVREHRLSDGDLIAIGHHQMRFAGPNSKSRTGTHPAQPADSDTTLVAARPDVQRTSSH